MSVSHGGKKPKGWTVVGGKVLRRELLMKDFAAAVRLIDAIAEIAESEGHHPDLHLTDYRRLVIELTTHSIGGLSPSDFRLAEKIGELHPGSDAPERRKRAAAP